MGPKHVAIIMDGNRRWAKQRGLPAFMGHGEGVKRVKELIKEAHNLGIKELTFYTFSMQNFNRSKEEVGKLMSLCEENFNKFADNKELKEKGVRVNIFGDMAKLPKSVVAAIKKVMSATKKGKNFTVNFALAYGGQEEIVAAAKEVIKKIKSKKLRLNSLNEDFFFSHLYLRSKPDLIIRTGGEKRLSNFR